MIFKKNQKGFTLLEIMAVLVILGLLVGLVAPRVMGRIDDAQIGKVAADFKTLETALKLYRLDNSTYPTTEQGLEALVTKPNTNPTPKQWKSGGYIDQVPLDPWGNPYLYQSPGESSDFDIATLGADNIAGGEGINADRVNH